MFNPLKTRNGKLRDKFANSFQKNKLTEKEIDLLMSVVEDYEKINLDTIKKLKKNKLLESKRISGALKQTINAHGPITKELIGSATKRIYGSLLINHEDENLIKIHKGNFILICSLIFVIIVTIIII